MAGLFDIGVGRDRRLWRVGAGFGLSCLALALATVIGSEFHIPAANMALLYLLIVALHALTSSFVSSTVISAIAAAACLAYFFSPPRFSLRVSHPSDLLAFLTFLVIALVTTWLVSNQRDARRDTEERYKEVFDNASDSILF